MPYIIVKYTLKMSCSSNTEPQLISKPTFRHFMRLLKEPTNASFVSCFSTKVKWTKNMFEFIIFIHFI